MDGYFGRRIVNKCPSGSWNVAAHMPSVVSCGTATKSQPRCLRPSYEG